MKLVVVTPVFEDRVTFVELVRRLSAALGTPPFIVAVDDGSVADPTDTTALKAQGIEGVVLTLTRNVGHQRAIAVGLAWVATHLADTEQVVIMDSDGEDRPESVPDLLEALNQHGTEVVVAERRKRTESLRFRLFYAVYRALFKMLTGRNIRFGNFMALNNLGMHRLATMGETALHVAGSVLISRLRWHACPIDRGHRYAGQSKMNFVSLALHGFKALMVFAEDVLVRVGTACIAIAGLSVLGMTAAIVLKSIGIATPGWFSVALGVLVLMFLQTGAITLMTLMMTGIMRAQLVLPIDHNRLIKRVAHAENADATPPTT